MSHEVIGLVVIELLVVVVFAHPLASVHDFDVGGVVVIHPLGLVHDVVVVGVVVVPHPLGLVHVSDELVTGFFVDSIEVVVLVSGSLLISIISVGLTGPVPDLSLIHI